MGYSASKLGENALLYCLGAMCFPMLVSLRAKTREKYNIASDVESDALVSGICCFPCANCQVANELTNRGL